MLFVLSFFAPVADARDFACIDLGLLTVLATPPVVAKRDAAAFATGFAVVIVLAARALTQTYFVTPYAVAEWLVHR